MNDKISKLILRLDELNDKQNEENIRVYTSHIIEEIFNSIGFKMIKRMSTHLLMVVE